MTKKLRASNTRLIEQGKTRVMGHLLSPRKDVRENFDPEKFKKFYGLTDAEWVELKAALIADGSVEEF